MGMKGHDESKMTSEFLSWVNQRIASHEQRARDKVPDRIHYFVGGRLMGLVLQSLNQRL